MAEPLKNMYNENFFEGFISAIKRVYPDFNKVAFLNDIYAEDWEGKELKDRMYRISSVLYKHLNSDFSNAVKVIRQLVEFLKSGQDQMSFEYMFLPDLIEKNGLDEYETSVSALEDITQFTSCEFAVRPFIIKYPQQMMEQMYTWSTHQNQNVRRLASEGCRPRLPWAMALPALKENPKPILPILKNLKNDPSEFVRRSVANNLNDISKDNSSLVVDIAKTWFGKTKETDALVKHACRTLLKQGNQEMMELFGSGSSDEFKIKKFKVTTPKVKIGESLAFAFQLINSRKTSAKIRLEYGLYFQKANGALSKKVFKISEKVYPENSTTVVNRKQTFRVITTRKYHPGLHQVSIIVNGKEHGKISFELVD
ncbi:MAG: DNA alkylation repair protein [Cyclobacteriaceae bacterium]